MDRYAVKRGGVTLLRVALFGAVLFAVGGVTAALLGFLGIVTVLGTASALLDAGTLPLLLAGSAGVLGLGFAGLTAYALLRIARRVDGELLDAVGPLDRLSALQARYVRDEVDEAAFESELAALLDADRVSAEDTVPEYDESERTPRDGNAGGSAETHHESGERPDESAPARELVRER
jgi:hypothetical protein